MKNKQLGWSSYDEISSLSSVSPFLFDISCSMYCNLQYIATAKQQTPLAMSSIKELHHNDINDLTCVSRRHAGLSRRRMCLPVAAAPHLLCCDWMKQTCKKNGIKNK